MLAQPYHTVFSVYPYADGISQADIDRAFAHGTEFFNLPEETKAKSQVRMDLACLQPLLL